MARELPADQGERWANRVIFAIGSTGVEIPDEIANAGMAGVAALGIGSLLKVPFPIAEPLLDEMFECIQYQHKPGAPLQAIMPGNDSQIEEVKTRWRLRMALFELHLGFSPGAVALTTASPPSAAKAA